MIIVRKAEPKDADRIAELYAQLVNNPARHSVQILTSSLKNKVLLAQLSVVSLNTDLHFPVRIKMLTNALNIAPSRFWTRNKLLAV